MRLIDADALVRDFPIRLDHYDEKHGNVHFVYGIETVIEYIEDMPTIDAVAVVRCKDCYHYFTSEDMGFCGSWGAPTEEDGFCSEARRNDEP